MDSLPVDRALRRVEAAALDSITALHYFDDGDRHANATAEHAAEKLALAARDLVRAVDQSPEKERPIGWATDEASS